MISPSTQNRQGSPRFFRNLLRVYVARHVLGVVLFLWLLAMAWTNARPFTWILLALLLAYAGYAVYGTRKIHKMYQASLRRTEAQKGG